MSIQAERNRIAACFNERLTSVCDDAKSRASIARNLERGCKNLALEQVAAENLPKEFWSTEFQNRYTAAYYFVATNLEISGGYFAKKLVSGEFRPFTAATLRAEDVCPEHRALRDSITARENAKSEEKFSKLHTCSRCASKTIIIEEHQTRAADEASSICYRCKSCGHSWVK